MDHNSDKSFFEYLIKNILQYYNLVEDNLKKSEKPDFKNDTIGLEVTRADPTLAFDGFISKYNKEKIGNIKKFNKNFEKLGGKVLKKSDPIVKLLDLHDTFHYHDDYLYIIPSYPETFDFVNQIIDEKLIRLNTIYDHNIEHYYLGLFTPIYVFENKIIEELYRIEEIQSNYIKKFEKIIIIFIDKICEFNLLSNTYIITENSKNILNNISFETYKNLYDQQ